MLISEAFKKKRKPQKRSVYETKPLPRPGCYWLCGHDAQDTNTLCSCEESPMGFKVSEEFSGSYLKAADLVQPKTLTISSISQVEMEGERKLAVSFAGEQQQLLLNKTNGVTISSLYGDDTDGWIGKAVELYSTQTSFGGRIVPCVRVRQPQQQLPHYPQQPQQPQAVQQYQPQVVQPQAVQPQRQPVQAAPVFQPPLDA